jgi:hypothetical protein
LGRAELFPSKLTVSAGLRIDTATYTNQITAMKFSGLAFFFWCGMVSCLCAHPQLDRLQLVLERGQQAAEEEFRTARLSLPSRYMPILHSMEVYFEREPNPAVFEPIRQARQQFMFDPTPSALDVGDAPPALAQLRENFTREFSAAAERRQERLKALQEQYIAGLTKLRTELAQQGESDAFLKVSNLLAELQPGTGARPAPRTPGGRPQPQIQAPTGGRPSHMVPAGGHRSRARQWDEEDGR